LQVPLKITFRDIESSPALEERIRVKSEKLERHYDKITSCHVTISAPHKHQHKGRIYSVRIDIKIPGGSVVVTREPAQNHAHEDAHVALRDAFNAAERQLDDRVERRRGQVKSHVVPAHGRVVRVAPEENYGILETSDGLEVYFHRNSVSSGGFDRVTVGAEVRFSLSEGEGEKGPQASTVDLVGKHHVVD